MSTMCTHCAEDIQSNSRGYWWHSDTGHVQCELYATPPFAYPKKGDHQ